MVRGTEEETVHRQHLGDGGSAYQFIFDAWTSLSFKRAIGNLRTRGISWLAPDWVGEENFRRLQAYKVLQAYVDNSSRFFLQLLEVEDIDEHREYGDAALLRDRILDALLGEEQHIQTEDAEDYAEDLPDTMDAAEKEKITALKPRKDLQDWFEEWADDERFTLKYVETERDAVGLGDGVYTLGWSTEKERPRLRVFDPGFYFPVLSDNNEDDYPEKVHIAWELDNPDSSVRKIRRITWELVEGEAVKHPWNDKATTEHCILSDGTWYIPTAGPQTVDDFREGEAEWMVDSDGEVQNRDLGIDFLPVLHIPNSVSIKNHFGQSALATVLQVIDDLANADTDLQKASATTGFPPISLSGATMGGGTEFEDRSLDVERPHGRPRGTLKYEPGSVWEIGDGRMDMLDTSKSLAALISYVEHLAKRAAVNARTPESVLGRVDPAKLPSGVALALSFGPLTSLIQKMRLVRQEKYSLLFKFVHRIAQAGGMADVPDEYFQTELVFGSFLPVDEATAVANVSSLLTAHAISLETAMKMLIEVGLPIEDAIDEVKRINRQNFEAAVQLFDATGDVKLVSDFLDVKVNEAAAAVTGEPVAEGAPPTEFPELPVTTTPTPASPGVQPETP